MQELFSRQVDLFRSQDMKYLAITMTNEAAHATVRELGKLGKLHLIDVRHTASPGAHLQLLRL